MAKNILITGANGQLGFAIYNKLYKYFNVIPTSFSKNSNSLLNFKQLDITNVENIKIIFNEIHPEIIINCAAYTNVDKCEINKLKAHNINVQGLRNLIINSQKDTYIIHFSTDYIYDGLKGPYEENDHPFPLNYYGKTKLESENILVGSTKKYLIIRSNVVFSENLNYKSNFFSWIYSSLQAQKEINVVDDQISNPTYVGDLVDIIFKSILLNNAGIFNYGGDSVLSRYEFANLIAEIFKFDKKLIHPISTEYLLNNYKNYIANRPKNSSLMTDKIEHILDIEINSIEYNLNKIKNIIYQT